MSWKKPLLSTLYTFRDLVNIVQHVQSHSTRPIFAYKFPLTSPGDGSRDQSRGTRKNARAIASCFTKTCLTNCPARLSGVRVYTRVLHVSFYACYASIRCVGPLYFYTIHLYNTHNLHINI